MPVSHLLAFAGVALLLIVIPGPSVLFVIGRSISLGRRGGLLSVLGNALGGTVPVALVALGLGTIVAGSALVFTIVKLLGAAYLVYLGVQTIRHRKDATAAIVRPAGRPGRVLRQGFLVGVSNPKSIVFLAAVLPQFVVREAGAVPLQLALLGAIYLTIGVLSDRATLEMMKRAHWLTKQEQKAVSTTYVLPHGVCLTYPRAISMRACMHICKELKTSYSASLPSPPCPCGGWVMSVEYEVFFAFSAFSRFVQYIPQ